MKKAEKLKGKICLIAPNYRILEMGKKVSEEFGYHLTTYRGNLHEGVEAARKAMADGAEIIISRGGTAKLIERELDCEVVYIVFSVVDFLRTVDESKKFGDQIGMLGFEDLFGDIDNSYDFPDYNLHVKQIGKYENIEEEIEKMSREKGVNVFIGGDAIVQAAEKMGFIGLLIECDLESVRRALSEAIRLAELKMKESERYLEFKAITEHSSEGMIFLDENGQIKYINPLAYQFFERMFSRTAIMSLPIRELFPKTYEEIPKGNPVFQIYETIRDIKIVSNYIPLNMDGRFLGGLISFQNVTRIEELEKRIRRELYSKGHVAKHYFRDFSTVDTYMKTLLKNAKRLAAADSSILIIGESGTGKELMAQSIHNDSQRRNGPFVAVNCAALPKSVLESELFGYVDGAFTGAKKAGKPGLFELAHRGAIFLDEIGDMPLNIQGHLLRVIQEKEVTRIGDDRVIAVDIRIISATNRDLRKMVSEGSFREDLFYRLDIVRIKMPSLRDRMDDLPVLCEYFLPVFSQANHLSLRRLSLDAIERMKRYSWPGNIRELQNFIESAVIMSEDEEIQADVIDQLLRDRMGGGGEWMRESVMEKEENTLRELEQESILKILKQVQGNRSKAAKILGISTTTLWRKLRNFN
ncbi:MAG: sigma 54-interacting transcriptional regulator [Peptococcaceae bacterium]|jgi:transcriptional regulator with PAS, ATPase and Fis domain|nr:sigma 54-interacting transcriptional regulator [Peptococcaceae bacterium]